MRKIIQSVTYSDGGLQHPASIGVSFADLYCLSVCNEEERKNKLQVKYGKEKRNFTIVEDRTPISTSEPYIF